MLRQQLLEVKDTLAKSPMRKEGKKPVSPQTDGFSKIENQVDILLSNLEKELAIVLMGEVKSGKSTMINALAGGKVSPTNTLECTSAILEISYSPTERAEIVFHDGSSTVASVGSVFDTLEDRRGDEEFFRQCEAVKVGYPLPHLKNLRLVDTPGLATITESNEKTTTDYIQSADVVLWVLNANTLGDTEVTTRLSEVAKAGKPIVLVVNRIDQVDSQPERLVDYVRSELGIYAQEVFPLSAEQAFNGVTEDDPNLMKSSGFQDLVDYLEQKIDVRADDAKDESIRSSVEALLRYDLAMHDAYVKQLAFLEAELGRHHEEVMRRSDKIVFNLQNWLRDRVHAPGGRALLENEMQRIIESKNMSPEEIKQELSLDAVKVWWSQVFTELGREFASEWEDAERAFIEDFSARMGSLDYRKLAEAELAVGDEDDVMGRAITGIGEGIKIGGIAGAGLAAYVTWAGAYAASAFLPILGTFMPPLLIAGGLGGLVSSLLSKRKKKGEVKRALMTYVGQVRADFIGDFLVPQVYPAIHEQCTVVANKLHSQLREMLSNGWSEQDISALKDDLRAYMQSIDLLLPNVARTQEA